MPCRSQQGYSSDPFDDPVLVGGRHLLKQRQDQRVVRQPVSDGEIKFALVRVGRLAMRSHDSTPGTDSMRC